MPILTFLSTAARWSETRLKRLVVALLRVLAQLLARLRRLLRARGRLVRFPPEEPPPGGAFVVLRHPATRVGAFQDALVLLDGRSALAHAGALRTRGFPRAHVYLVLPLTTMAPSHQGVPR